MIISPGLQSRTVNLENVRMHDTKGEGLGGCYIGMCGPKGYGFSAVSVINKVSILADFGRLGHK